MGRSETCETEAFLFESRCAKTPLILGREIVVSEELGGGERRGRGQPVRQSERLTLLVEPGVLRAIDAWIADRTGAHPSRSEAARMLLVEQLRASGYLKG